MANTKEALSKAREITNRHKQSILLGYRMLCDEELRAQFMKALTETTYDQYKKKVLYEEALDYASK